MVFYLTDKVKEDIIQKTENYLKDIQKIIESLINKLKEYSKKCESNRMYTEVCMIISQYNVELPKTFKKTIVKWSESSCGIKNITEQIDPYNDDAIDYAKRFESQFSEKINSGIGKMEDISQTLSNPNFSSYDFVACSEVAKKEDVKLNSLYLLLKQQFKNENIIYSCCLTVLVSIWQEIHMFFQNIIKNFKTIAKEVDKDLNIIQRNSYNKTKNKSSVGDYMNVSAQAIEPFQHNSGQLSQAGRIMDNSAEDTGASACGRNFCDEEKYTRKIENSRQTASHSTEEVKESGDVKRISTTTNIIEDGENIKFTIQSSNIVLYKMDSECFGEYQTSNGGKIIVFSSKEGCELSIDKETYKLLQLDRKIPVFYEVSCKIGGKKVTSYKLIFQQDCNIMTLENAEFMSKNVNTGDTEKAVSMAPRGIDSRPLNVHHLTRESIFTIYVELEESYHQKFKKLLHSAIKDGESYRNDEFLKKQFNNFMSGYYEDRLFRFLEKFTKSDYKRTNKYI